MTDPPFPSPRKTRPSCSPSYFFLTLYLDVCIVVCVYICQLPDRLIVLLFGSPVPLLALYIMSAVPLHCTYFPSYFHLTLYQDVCTAVCLYIFQVPDRLIVIFFVPSCPMLAFYSVSATPLHCVLQYCQELLASLAKRLIVFIILKYRAPRVFV